ncbi:MAG: hypothetical protein QXJ74_07935 [Nitrososphaera sp.]|uniref:hypothetical protein n=1 Tax=Nitrososphaera sp. TaxID=1971748 RepID=UPI00317A4773
MQSSAAYSFLWPREHVWNGSALIADCRLPAFSSGTYSPGNTSPQVLHFNISLGI